jgi:AcrR family transcriptional regulator
MRVLLVFFNSLFVPDAEPRKRPRQRRSQETVARILDAAARIFGTEGYQRTTTNHIAAEAEISIGSLYQYFPNKDALLVALADRHLDEASTALAGIAAGLRATAPSLEGVCRTLVTAAVALNSPDSIHHLLWQAPRTEALTQRFAAFEAELALEVAWHLERFGHDPRRAHRRAEVMVTAVTAAVHMCPPGDDLADELVALCLGYAAGTPHDVSEPTGFSN